MERRFLTPQSVFRFTILLFFMLCFWSAQRAVAQPRHPLPVKLILSVDWEGFSLDKENLAAMQIFRDQHPDIKLVHFLNAAYFTKKNADSAKIREQIRSVILPGDELGLHIHAFESLLDAAGVQFRDDETYWGNVNSKYINGDRGHDVPLSLFSVEEARRLIRTSLNILGENGFGPITSFRAGGWMGSPEVLEAVAREGIQVDSSAVSPDLVGLVAGPQQPIYRTTKRLWPLQTPMRHEPYVIQTPGGLIQEYPDHIALADYVNSDQAFKYFDDLVTLNFKSGEPVYFHYGFHQETANVFLPEVSELLAKIDHFIQRYRVELKSVTMVELQGDHSPTGSFRDKYCRASLQ